MQRDLNLIRDLLLFYESEGVTAFPTADHDAIRQHLIMLFEAGLIDGRYFAGAVGMRPCVTPIDTHPITKGEDKFHRFNLTWSGHDWLAAARNEKVWKKVTTYLGTAISGMTFAIVKEYLEKAIKGDL